MDDVLDKSIPAITVLMPVYNAERYVKYSIESILAQTYRDFEFLIINDGSKDNTRDIVLSYSDPRIKFFENETNMGMIGTLNKGLSLARGKYIARQDGDDISMPQRLETQKDYLDLNPSITLVGTNGIAIDESGKQGNKISRPSNSLVMKWRLFFDNVFIHTSVMFRVPELEELYGDYRMSDCCGDYDLWSKIAMDGKATNIEKAFVFYREHSASIIGSIPVDEAKARIADLENREIIKRNLDTVFGPDAFSEKEAAALRFLVLGVSLENSAEFLGVFEKLLSAYRDKFPEAKYSPEFKKEIASQLALTGYMLLEDDRRAAFSLFRRALSESPLIFIKLLLSRAASPATLGSVSRRFCRALCYRKG